jgi:hypothetical protein
MTAKELQGCSAVKAHALSRSLKAGELVDDFAQFKAGVHALGSACNPPDILHVVRLFLLCGSKSFCSLLERSCSSSGCLGLQFALGLGDKLTSGAEVAFRQQACEFGRGSTSASIATAQLGTLLSR